jgi:hypothetical protein
MAKHKGDKEKSRKQRNSNPHSQGGGLLKATTTSFLHPAWYFTAGQGLIILRQSALFLGFSHPMQNSVLFASPIV